MNTVYFVSKRLALKVEQNQDGTLNLTNYHDGTPFADAGMLIKSTGSIDNFLALCIDEERAKARMEAQRICATPEYRKEQARRSAQRAAEREALATIQHKAAFDALPRPIPATYDNIGVVLRYLRDQNYGTVDLPSMTIGYTFNMYDCDGKLAAAMVMDKDIIEDGENFGRKFQVGAPSGHLMKYRRA